MKVLFDVQIFESQRIGGVSRYFFELFNEFDKSGLVEWELPVVYSSNEYLKILPKFNSVPNKSVEKFLPGIEFKGKGFLHRIKNKALPSLAQQQSEENKHQSIQKIKEGNFDIFHPTYYDDYFLEYIGHRPYVLTVYDCIHQIFPEFYFAGKDKHQLLLDKASRIIAISESTKRDLVNLFSINEDKIDVTLLANSLQNNTDTTSATFNFEIPEKFFLFVGGREGYKNFLFFVHIFSVLVRLANNIHLICTGAAFSKEELRQLKKNGLEGRVHQTFVNDEQLCFLYKKAIALIFPSLYEGFGLPVLEAFHNGCPTVVSRTSSLIEISGDAAVLIEPKEPASMLSALKNILFNEDLRNSKISAGYKQEKKFSWKNTAEQTKLSYEKVLSH